MERILVGRIEAVPTSTFKMEDCFFEPTEWDEDSKQRYTEWLARQADSHPSKQDPRPWEYPAFEYQSYGD